MPDPTDAAQTLAAHCFPVKPAIAARAHVDAAKYGEMYQRAVSDPDGFWAEQSKRVDWIKPPTRIKDTSFIGNVSIK